MRLLAIADVVHRLINVAAGTDRIGEHEAAALHDEVDGIVPAVPEPEPAPPTSDELAAFRAWQAGQAGDSGAAANG